MNVNKVLFPGLLLLISLPAVSMAQITDFKAHTYENGEGNELNYRMMKPADYDSSKSYPLVLFLHGAGERGSDNFSQLKWGVHHFADPGFRKQYPAFVVAPQVPEGEYWSWLDLDSDSISSSFVAPMRETPTEPMQLTIELLERLQEEYAVDADRLYVTGLSMGGFGTFALIERFPGKFAAAVPICGGGDAARAFLLKEMPIWVFHGTEDQAVDVRYSRTMVEAIQLAGGSPGYTEYPDAGHVEAWVQAYRDPTLYEWMFSKSKEKRKGKSNE
ncbi:prolyl oligopeptidase family serine peptidase [Fodinibius sp.]|uniref:carboxylesterase family protein n=1 Tax=Fodinibius sp. TaxID=1872440 RepID=UPI003567A97D